MSRSRQNLAAVFASALLSLALLTLVKPGRAEPVSPDTARDLVRSGEILSLEDILNRMQPGVEGEIIEVALEAERRRYLYRIKALGHDGRYRDYCADATAGAAVKP
jgi:uncharacterized membrane protein YkoI